MDLFFYFIWDIPHGMKRRYEEMLNNHFQYDSQMAFLSGPRQVGKTTSSWAFSPTPHYFSWDNDAHRQIILSGAPAVADDIGAGKIKTIIFDELHKYPEWKNFLKGFYDTFGKDKFKIVVTGSSRLDTYRKGADSLMGRYFLYHMFPLSVAEIASSGIGAKEISGSKKISKDDYTALERFGGFPEPYLKRNMRFYNRWKQMRLKQLFRDEIRDVSKIYETGQVEILAELLRTQTGQLTNFSALATKIRASEQSIRRWVALLESLHYCFLLKPWTSNVSRTLRKNPKIYLTDWSLVDDPGARAENMIACHLQKAVSWWQDFGFGAYGLCFLRTKDKREVDFLVTKKNRPWFLVEVKRSNKQPLNNNLNYFQTRIEAKHAFQVVIESDFENFDCFEYDYPVRVPALTFLSQLV
jgi:uncharacterized protein